MSSDTPPPAPVPAFRVVRAAVTTEAEPTTWCRCCGRPDPAGLWCEVCDNDLGLDEVSDFDLPPDAPGPGRW